MREATTFKDMRMSLICATFDQQLSTKQAQQQAYHTLRTIVTQETLFHCFNDDKSCVRKSVDQVC